MKHPFFPLLAPCLLVASFVAACGDEEGSGGAGGSDDGDTTASTGGTDASTSAETTGGSTSTGTSAACEGVTATVSFSADIQPILTAKCATTGCHVGTSPDGGMNLSEASAYTATVNKETKGCGGDRIRIIPSNPDESYLWDKIHGMDLCGTSGKMPPSTKPQLTDDEKAAITAWICGGALED